MKSIKTILAMAFLMALPFTFISCDDDDYWYEPPRGEQPDGSSDAIDMAQMMVGHWTGSLVAQGYDSNGILQKIAYSTDMELMQKNNDPTATEGRGVQNDYINNVLQYSRNFSWSINCDSGDITIVYDATSDADAYTMVIDYDDLYLSEQNFSGVMVGEGETDTFDFKWYSLSKKQ